MKNLRRIITFVCMFIYMLYLLPAVFAASGSEPGGIAIDATDFPDANFRSYVSNNFDIDGNGYLNDSERLTVTEIYRYDKSLECLILDFCTIMSYWITIKR